MADKFSNPKIVLTLASPMSTEEDLRPFFAILNGQDLSEIARAYLPHGYTLPIGFHGTFVKS